MARCRVAKAFETSNVFVWGLMLGNWVRIRSVKIGERKFLNCFDAVFFSTCHVVILGKTSLESGRAVAAKRAPSAGETAEVDDGRVCQLLP